MSKRYKYTSIFAKKDDYYYEMFHVWQERDGSLYITLHVDTSNSNGNMGIAQKLSTAMPQPGNTRPSIISSSTYEKQTTTAPLRISYHASGLIRYHGMNFLSQYGDPITAVNEPVWFFLLSVPQISRWKNPTHHLTNIEHSIVIDFSSISERVDIAFFLVSPSFSPTNNQTLIELKFADVCKLLIEVVVDKNTWRLGTIYQGDEFVKISPSLSKYRKQPISKEDAYTAYHRILTKNDSATIYAPNGEGFCEIVYAVPMRTVPMIKIEFDDPDLIIKKSDLKKDTFRAFFKVFSKRKGYIYDPLKIPIRSITLDAEIYDKDHIFPSDFL